MLKTIIEFFQDVWLIALIGITLLVSYVVYNIESILKKPPLWKFPRRK